MPNDKNAPKCICPYFEKERARAIVCHGVVRGSHIEQRFETPEGKLRQMQRACCGYHYGERCVVAAVLDKKNKC